MSNRIASTSKRMRNSYAGRSVIPGEVTMSDYLASRQYLMFPRCGSTKAGRISCRDAGQIDRLQPRSRPHGHPLTVVLSAERWTGSPRPERARSVRTRAGCHRLARRPPSGRASSTSRSPCTPHRASGRRTARRCTRTSTTHPRARRRTGCRGPGTPPVRHRRLCPRRPPPTRLSPSRSPRPRWPNREWSMTYMAARHSNVSTGTNGTCLTPAGARVAQRHRADCRRASSTVRSAYALSE